MALRITALISRLFLGSLFVIAGYIKLQNLFLFEMAVDAYQILPPWAVVIVAKGLPVLEIVLGLVLLSGWLLPYFSTFAALLMTVFVSMMAYTYSRGVEASCGCFGVSEKIGPWTLARDTGFLVVAVFLAVYSWKEWKKKRRAAFEPAPATSLASVEPLSSEPDPQTSSASN